MLLMNHRIKVQLEQALVRLGWGHYERDLWRHRKSGVIVSFLDAVVMELQISVQEKKPFQGRYFKEPREVSVEPGTSMPWMDTWTSYFDSALRKFKSFFRPRHNRITVGRTVGGRKGHA